MGFQRGLNEIGNNYECNKSPANMQRSLLVFVIALAMMFPGCAGAFGGGTTEVCQNSVILADDHRVDCHFVMGSDGDIEVEITVNSGPNVDVYTMTDMNFQQYESGNSFYYFQDVSGVDIAELDGSAKVSENEYHVVIINSNSENLESGISYRVAAHDAQKVEEKIESTPGLGAFASISAMIAGALVMMRRRDHSQPPL